MFSWTKRNAGFQTDQDAAIKGLFRVLLGREPEKAAMQAFRSLDSVQAIAAGIVSSPEFVGRHSNSSPFWHYHASFDAQALMHKYAVKDPQQRPGLIVNFLDVALAPKFLPLILEGMAGQVQPIPLPANWHADIAEWGAVLRAIDLAKDKFTMIELGCGWACWINNACVTAKRRGLRVHGIGVEGDAGHIEFAKEACALNNLGPDEVTLHNAIAGGRCRSTPAMPGGWRPCSTPRPSSANRRPGRRPTPSCAPCRWRRWRRAAGSTCCTSTSRAPRSTWCATAWTSWAGASPT
jgi:hypothetical protein